PRTTACRSPSPRAAPTASTPPPPRRSSSSRRSASVVERSEVERARAVVDQHLRRTPTLSSRTLGARLKCELFQRTGSFKSRGAPVKLASLDEEERRRGVITMSAGNHAQAVAYAAAEYGVDALVVMWQGASALKLEATRAYGATVDLQATNPVEASERVA